MFFKTPIKSLKAFSPYTILLSLSFFLPLESIQNFSYKESLTQDFPYRDSLTETLEPKVKYYDKLSWGPRPRLYPPIKAPEGVDELQWERDRVIAVAKKYLGLPYLHRHIPSQGGLDCSNFTAWVYNYGFGIQFTSHVQKQAEQAGRRLKPDESLEPGDLLFMWNPGKTKIRHVALYIDEKTLIDSTISLKANGVALRKFSKRYKKNFAFARRIF